MALANPSPATGANQARALAPIANLLACPGCRGGLDIESTVIRCDECHARYGLQDGVPLLAIRGASETWGDPQQTEQSTAYQAEYQRIERAAVYNLEYRRQILKRSSTKREFRLIRRHFEQVGHSRVVLDLPCGGSRLTPAFAEFADLVIEADIAIGPVLFGRSASAVATPRVWMTASAFHIPLRDAAVDGTVCVRLSHHLPTGPERDRLVRELLRVSRRFVVMTYFDHHSVKNRLRRLRQPFDHKPPKMTMTTARVAELAREQGARLVAAPALSRLGSGHRYALIVRDGART